MCAGVGSGGNFWKVPEGLGESSSVSEGSQESFGVACCLATLTGAARRLFLNPFWR